MAALIRFCKVATDLKIYKTMSLNAKLNICQQIKDWPEKLLQTLTEEYPCMLIYLHACKYWRSHLVKLKHSKHIMCLN